MCVWGGMIFDFSTLPEIPGYDAIFEQFGMCVCVWVLQLFKIENPDSSRVCVCACACVCLLVCGSFDAQFV